MTAERARRGALRGWELRPESTLFVPLVLRAARALRGPLRAGGLDPDRVELLLRLRLTVDLRGEGRQGASGLHFGIVLMLLLAWLAGLLMTVPALAGMGLVGWVALQQAGALWLVAFVLFVQLVPELLAPVDIGALLPHPVRDGELFAARLLHHGAYVVALSLALAFWPVALAGIAYRAHPAVLLVPPAVGLATLLTGLLALGGVALALAVLLRAFGPERFQRVTLWIQVFFLTLAMGGGQLVRLVAPETWLERAWASRSPWLGVLPPVQQAGLVELLTGTFEPRTFALSAAALALPALALAVALRLASRHFVAGLTGELTRDRGRGAWPRGPLERVGAALRLDRVQRAGYGLLAAHLFRDKVLVRATVPTALGLTLAIGASFSSFAGLGGAQSDPAGAPFGLLVGALYFATLIGITVAMSLQYGAQPDALAFAESLPVRDPQRFLGGAVRAPLVGLFLPLQGFLLAAAAIARWPALGPLDLALCALGTWALLLVALPALAFPRPLSRPSGRGATDVDALVVLFGTFAGVVALALAHAGLRLLPGGTLAGAVLAAAFVVRRRGALDRLRVADEVARVRRAA